MRASDRARVKSRGRAPGLSWEDTVRERRREGGREGESETEIGRGRGWKGRNGERRCTNGRKKGYRKGKDALGSLSLHLSF